MTYTDKDNILLELEFGPETMKEMLFVAGRRLGKESRSMEILEEALKRLNINKFRQADAGMVVHTGRLMSDHASMLGIAMLLGQKPILRVALEQDLEQVERRMAAAIGFSGLTERDFERRILGHDPTPQQMFIIDSMTMALEEDLNEEFKKQVERVVKPKKHWEHMNKKSKKGRW